MSSLSQQLKVISDKTASVALDRKTRSKIHSKSLIFDPKTASTQDYDYLYDIGLEGLNELIDLDSRFNHFQNSLFSDTSINFDRNVQTKEILDTLNKNVEAFLNLVAPYYSLAPTLKAIEWLVRRFYINIHNAETLLLSSLTYYQQPVFVKILNVIPKSSFPRIFEWVLGYKDLMKNPPNNSILKSFNNDQEFYKLYLFYLIEQLKNKTVFNQQLVFFLSNTIQLLASYNKELPKLNEFYLPTVLEVVGTMLLPSKEKISKNSSANDVKLTAYSVISVLGSIIPLTAQLIESFTDSILQDPRSFNGLEKQSLIVLGQLWNFYNQDNNLGSKISCFDRLSPSQLLEKESLIKSLFAENYKLNKFFIYYFLSQINDNENEEAYYKIFEISKFVNLDDSSIHFNKFTSKLLHLAESRKDETTRNGCISIFESLIKNNKDSFKNLLELEKKSIGDLEMLLMYNLNGQETHDADIEFADEEDEVDQVSDQILNSSRVDLSSLKTKTKSFFDSSTSKEFTKLSQAYIEALYDTEQLFKVKVAAIRRFGNIVFHGNKEVLVSFILRLSLTPAIPYATRVISLKALKPILSEIKDIFFYLLVPVLILGFYDTEKTIRSLFFKIAEFVHNDTRDRSKSKGKITLFMEDQIYGSTPMGKRSIITPQDAHSMLKQLFKEGKSNLSDSVLDRERLIFTLFEVLFNKKVGKILLKTFIMNQWSLSFWPIAFKSKIWSIISYENNISGFSKKGTSDRFFFLESDISNYVDQRPHLLEEAKLAKVEFFDDVEGPLVNMVGGKSSNENNVNKEIDWLIKALGCNYQNLQIAANERIIKIFPSLKAVDSKVKVCNELIDLLVNETDDELFIDPLETLQSFEFDHDSVIAVLSNVQIVTQVPEQGVAKRRRRSSNSTKQNMARNDISNMASIHLRKLTIALDVLENNLRNKVNDIAQPDLLQDLFRILTDLDYLGNDGNLPVLYAQETLALCMLLSIVTMKKNSKTQNFKFDSNSVRSDLIVNSIRLSSSPQVQNRFLLVIAELAALAPEIILHSVMPIFTFMGAHTIRQDDEFSSSALQQTIAKVIPALASSGSSSLSNEIEFLLTSFVTAFQHIPRHRRVKLFVSLTRTLGYANSLHIIIFLIGQQYNMNNSKGKMTECNALLEFATSLLKSFKAKEILESFAKFYELWNELPNNELESNSEQFNKLSSRSIFGNSIVSSSSEELIELKAQLLRFINQILNVDQELNQVSSSIKLKVSLTLIDTQSSKDDKNDILSNFSQITSLILSSLESFANLEKSEFDSIQTNLYDLLSSYLNLLPLNYFVDSIIISLQEVNSPISIRVARNFAILAGTKFESELNSNSIDENIQQVVSTKLLPVLIDGVETVDHVELVQSYLDTFAIIVNKFGVITTQMTNSDNTKVLINSLKIIVTEKGLLNEQPEVIISSINAISSIINVLGIKTIGLFPKVLPPALKIWERTIKTNSSEAESDSDSEMEEENESNKLIQASILALISCLVKKMPGFIIGSLEKILSTVLYSDLIETSIRSSILDLIVEHVEKSQLMKSLCNLSLTGEFYQQANASDLGLYLNVLQNTINKIDKKSASGQSTLFMNWLIKSFEFRNDIGEEKYNVNTIARLESSFHECGITYVMKLNDKTFRPLFANLVRWAINGEGSLSNKNTEVTRLLAFFKFFNKLQENLKSIITSYFSYLLDGTSNILNRFCNRDIEEINLRRLILNSLTSSFKYDQEDYWSQQLRFESVMEPLIGQLQNIEENIGKYLVKAITSFIINVSSDEYNEKLVYGLIKYITNESEENNSNTKIWTIRTLKSIFQKMGEQWLSYLPTFIPYIAELLEDDDESVEMEVRSGLVRVIENVLGEPLDRYLD